MPPAESSHHARTLPWALGALLLGLALALCAPAPASAQPLILHKLPFAQIAASAGQAPADAAERLMRVLATEADGSPVRGVPVRFSVLSLPAGIHQLALRPPLAFTNAEGIAEARVTLGQRPGTYAIGAVLANAAATEAPLVFSYAVRDLRWWALLLIGLMGGLAIFLYGMGLMSEGMTQVLGDRMRSLLGSLTHNRFVAVAVGTLVTMVIQSSSATTVMLVGFVQAQLMTFAQTIGVILGARIGTTITAQIIAFRITDYALLFVAAGFALMLLPRRDQIRSAGQGLLGFGLLFFGMRVMADAMQPLSAYEPFLRLIVALEHPVLGVLVGTVLTALIQSSSAFTGILIVLASQGLLTLHAAIPLVLGANVGTSITAMLASLNTRRAAKRVALAHTLFHVSGVLIFMWLVDPFATVVRWVSPAAPVGTAALAAAALVVPREIANAHTLFNVTITLLFLPFTGQITRLVTWLLPDLPAEREAPFKAVYLDESMLATPAFALSLARSEVIRMAELVKRMVEQCVEPFVSQRREVLAQLAQTEEEVNFLQDRIDDYLTRIGQRNVTEGQTEEAFQLVYSVTELEQIADIVNKSIRPRAQDWLAFPRRFSPQGEAEIRAMHLSAVKQVARAITLLRETTPAQARHIYEKYQKYRAMEFDFMRSHFERLRRAVPESVATNEFHQELMEQLVRIASHATNIARILLAADAERAAQSGLSGTGAPPRPPPVPTPVSGSANSRDKR
ncbi:MAG TPA: Na/Pi symporter [bacterium]|nr:Na/Pi symporter [bacterium]